MKYFLLLSIFLLSSNIFSQTLSGKIEDKNGDVIYGSTVYIKETKQGIVCNDNGEYKIKLHPGNYTIEYKCLGFKTKERKIEIEDKQTVTIDIVLEENTFSLKEVSVSSKEDPAYEIIRKAITYAPIYANAVKKYTAEVYIKGNAELLKISSITEKLAKRAAEGVKLSDLKNQLFTQETFSQIDYTAPDKYKQTVRAFASSIPDNLDSKEAMGIMNASFYQPKLNGRISPLHPNAFSYYKFRYEGFAEEAGLAINKIKVIPKLKDPLLFDGYIYITDNSWHLHSVDLTNNANGAKQTYNINYEALAENAYLPTTYIIASEISIFGIQATLSFYASLKYLDLTLNEKDNNTSLVTEKKIKKREFEIKRDSLYNIVADSLAQKRDSIYWKSVRVIPLDEKEIVGFYRKDSIQHRMDSIRKAYKNPKFRIMDIFEGGKIGSDSSKITIKYDGLILAAPEYNFVDGVWLGQKLKIEKKLKKNQKMEFSPYAYYASARKRVLGGIEIKIPYSPIRLGELQISAASVSEDFNPDGITRLNNASSSLIYGKNYNYFYQKDHISLNNNIDLANGLRLGIGMEIARRSGLNNNTEYTWGRHNEITENMYIGKRFDKTSYYVGIQYIPYAYYSIREGVKKYESFTSPIFSIIYNEGLGSWQTNNSKYRKIEINISQYLNLSEFDKFDYHLQAGSFLGNNKQASFTDYKHFNTSNVRVNLKSPFSAFMLLDNYAASTNKKWVEMQMNWESKYILLKRIPIFQGKMFTETIHLKELYTPDFKFYTELGYSINLTKLLNAGAFVSFKKEKYQSFGLRILFDLENIKNSLR